MSSLTPRDLRPGPTTLRVHRGALASIHDHARRGFPHEVVGILAGKRAGLEVSLAHALENERAGEDATRRFKVDALTVLKAEMALAAKGLEVVGYYHSHPDHPANYSDTDLAMALPDTSYVITAVHGHEDTGPTIVDTRSWRLAEDRAHMQHEPIELTTP